MLVDPGNLTLKLDGRDSTGKNLKHVPKLRQASDSPKPHYFVDSTSLTTDRVSRMERDKPFGVPSRANRGTPVLLPSSMSWIQSPNQIHNLKPCLAQHKALKKLGWHRRAGACWVSGPESENFSWSESSSWKGSGKAWDIHPRTTTANCCPQKCQNPNVGHASLQRHRCH